MNATFPNYGIDIVILTNNGSGLDPYVGARADRG